MIESCSVAKVQCLKLFYDYPFVSLHFIFFYCIYVNNTPKPCKLVTSVLIIHQRVSVNFLSFNPFDVMLICMQIKNNLYALTETIYLTSFLTNINMSLYVNVSLLKTFLRLSQAYTIKMVSFLFLVNFVTISYF